MSEIAPKPPTSPKAPNPPNRVASEKRVEPPTSPKAPNPPNRVGAGAHHDPVAISVASSRMAAFATDPAPSRASYHAVLDALLDHADNSRPWLFLDDVHAAVRKLAAAASGGVGHYRSDEAWEALEADPAAWRWAMRQHLAAAPYMLSGRALAALLHALAVLDDGAGAAPPLLRPIRAAGKGVNPRLRRQAERQLLLWAHHAAGRGVPLAAAQARVHNAQLLAKWRAAWVRERSAAYVAAALRDAEAQGRWARRSGRGSEQWPAPLDELRAALRASSAPAPRSAPAGRPRKNA